MAEKLLYLEEADSLQFLRVIRVIQLGFLYLPLLCDWGKPDAFSVPWFPCLKNGGNELSTSYICV